MKPFNLEEFKAGKPAITRDGRKARYLYTMLAPDHTFRNIVVILDESIGQEFSSRVNDSGRDHAEYDNDILWMYERKFTDTERLDYLIETQYHVRRLEKGGYAVFNQSGIDVIGAYLMPRSAIDALIMRNEE